ncbi:relaxase domain-containing protein [Calidifontibacter sp. DB0510]|uniref:Relaxase domain-containing protein n=2 Tax=Metallococcus carri TaxID=1656884 RepID=A0A967B2B1_9MICO|nr:MobF family relaxase [Metallococcus carri]NHN54342.1 relaxase domain-containing protein [Metallococcus carri]NOP36818.1 relaxase domain-containing protein [Calidifontibacter sp. DB2511S]
MTVSMRVMSAGDGYKYLLRSVAAADGDRSLSTPLTRYYAEEGTPPGRWLGSGLAGLGGGQLATGDQVSEPQLQLLVGMGRDPVTGEPLGRAFPDYAPVTERIKQRVDQLPVELGPAGRAEAIAQIEAEETARGSRRAVAGFDYTFSVPKSVSVLWGVADAGAQALIAQAHHEAVAEVVDFMEREVAATRTGITAAGDGAVAQVDVTGLIATGFDHYDSRAGDPQLHTHVVVSNKVQTAMDGRWRSLDGRPMHAAVVSLSEHYNAVLADRLTRTFGLGWEARERGRDRNPSWEITAVPETLIAAFSTRSHDIEVEADRLIAEYVTEHGRRPSAATIVKLRAQATLATRPDKQVRSLADLTEQWRTRASVLLGHDATAWARGVTGTDTPAVLRADDVPLETVAALGAAVVAVVGEKRSTWRRWNLHAEASRQTMGWRFASTRDREAIVGMVVDAAEKASLRLTPPELAASPAVFRRVDGTSVFRPKHSTAFSAEDLLAAEDRLLDRSRTLTAPTVPVETMERIVARPDSERRMLSEDQAQALTKVAVSGRVIDVLVGPAGAGKTTAMSALRRAWEKHHGPGSVVGLAPSAVAAQVLADDLGIATENTAKWWTNHLAHGTTFQAGQLVILDEASLAGTLSLDRITALAEDAGAKVLLVGDYAQLQSVDAGGAFSLLVNDRDDAPELVDVHRFTHAWEKTASLALRHGHTEVIDTYLEHDRIHDGDAELMSDAAYAAWCADRDHGLVSVLIAETRDDVTTLNQRARADLILDGTLTPGREVELNDGTTAGVGDTIITRRNDRRLRNHKTWVRNGDTWTITNVRDDGSITIRPTGRHFGGSIVLPASYVAEQVDLGYAVTGHRAQGLTTDSAHVLVESTTTRENLYVAMTRGRQSNQAYVILDRPDDHAHPHPGDNPDATARTVLHGVLQHTGAELSAHETITAEQDTWGSIAQLAAEYETIAAVAQHDRWATLIRASGLTEEQSETVIESEAFGALTAELRRAEANHHDMDQLLPRLVQARGFDDADDIAAVLHHRVVRATARPAGSGRTRQAPRLITGLIPYADGPMSEDMRQALNDRRELIEARADAVLDAALDVQAPWTQPLGTPPREARKASAWREQARVIAAYRDRYNVTDDATLGAPPESTAQKVDAARARRSLNLAAQITADGNVTPRQMPRRTPERQSPTL